MNAVLYSIHEGRRISAASGSLKSVLSMLTLPGLRESVVLTKKRDIKSFQNFGKNRRPIFKGKKTKKGDKIYEIFLENEWQIQYIIIAQEKNDDESMCQLINFSRKNKVLYQFEEENSCKKRILFLSINNN